MPSAAVKAKAATNNFDRAINKRGQISGKPKETVPLGPVMLGFFVFVVCGSAIVEIIQSIQGRGMLG